MSNINLLPWREEHKKKQKIAFFVLLGISCGIILAICFTGKLYVDSMIGAQNERNQFLQTQTIVLDRRIKEIKTIKKEKKELVRRIELIQRLEERRNMVTRLFNTLTQSVPAGVYLTTVNFTGSKISVNGLTESNERVTKMLRQIDGSGWLGDALLSSIVAGPTKPIKLYKFGMQFVVLPETGESK